jgi:iron(III) transport system permease protein
MADLSPLPSAHRPAERWFFPLVATAVALLVLYPGIWLVLGSFRSASPLQPGDWTVANYVRAYAEPSLGRAVWNTVVFAVGQTCVAMTIGTLLAWIIARTNVPCRGLLEFFTLVLFLLPSIVMVVAWTLLLSPTRGFVNNLAMGLFGLDQAPFNIYGMSGMILVQGLSSVPFAYLIMAPAFAAADITLEESARMSGSGRWQIFTRITLPMTRPALAAATVLLFIGGIEAFDVPQLLGAPKGIYTFTALIFQEIRVREPSDYGAATALAMALQCAALLCMVVYWRLSKMNARFETVKGKGYRAGIVDLGRARWWLLAGCLAFFFVAVVLPLTATLLVSLVPFFSGFSTDMLGTVTLANYNRLLNHPALQRGVLNSALLAVGSAAVCVALAAAIAYLVAKERSTRMVLLDTLAMLPICVPATVLGIGLVWAYITLPLPIYGTVLVLGIAYVTRYIPLALRTTVAGVSQIGGELLEASTVSGASALGTFLRIVVPLIRVTLFASWVILVMIFFREFSMSILLAGPSNPVLSVVLYDYYESAEIGPLCAASLLLIALTTIVVSAAQRILSVSTRAASH